MSWRFVGYCELQNESKLIVCGFRSTGLSWPAASEEVPLTKANQTGKEKKGRREKEVSVSCNTIEL